MDLSIILLGIGIVALLLTLLMTIIKFFKGNYKISPVILSLLLVGLISISAGFVLMIPNEKEQVQKKEDVQTQAEQMTNEEDANEKDETEINEIEPLKIARTFVEQEMAKQVGLRKWEITEHMVYSDKNVYNIADYDKPEGDMRKVWITGSVRGTSDDGITGNVGYDLELYQMKGDTKWYIGEHWGVLANLEITDEPVVKERERNDEELPMGKESENPNEEKSVDAAKPKQPTLTENDLKGAWHWNDSDDFYMILRNDHTYSYIEKNAGFVSEGTYTVEKLGDQFKVTVHYTTDEYDSVMTINLIDKNRHEGMEDGNSWRAVRVNLADAEQVLRSVK
ncbi:hypothetical protein [Fredinandcohnia quinoae]|uniref:Uncharacterized protein n=1 Tax=Fredinandcohnia quinoae TaxID=2918902 RepID=A0AAW5EDD7_9BACI|nr:hypothetical protein [Fredinandcohnia sp. SECRCQ15]MCH1627730.1 hypothetical protein [Fredinandcohnia sp. SECRCQ15]